MSKELIVVEAEIEKLYIPKGGNVVKIVNKDNYRLLSDITKEKDETIAKLQEEIEFRDWLSFNLITVKTYEGKQWCKHKEFDHEISITDLRAEFLKSKTK